MITPDPLRAIFFYGDLEINAVGHQFVDIYKDDIDRTLLPMFKEGTVAVDVGGNIGLVSMYLSRYCEKIFTLEPSWEHFDALNRNLQINEIKNVKPINKALYMKDGVFPYGGPAFNKTMRSLHADTWQDGKSSENVEAITLETLIKNENLDRIDLLKLDVEGSEAEIICSESFKNASPKIKAIIFETHKWSGRHPNQIMDSLKSMGYQVRGFPHDNEIFIAERK